MSRGSVCSTLVLIATVVPIAAAGANITEDFTQPANPSTTGSTLGVCAQLTVGLAGNGSITVSGNGEATISTPAAADAAILYSTHALPGSGYTVSVDLTNINYDKYAQENGVTLLALADVKPQTSTEIWWGSHRLIGVEANVFPGGGPNHPLFITYWTSSAMYTWNGTAWATGPASYVPALIYDPNTSYTVELQKGARNNSYTVRVRSGGVVLTQASVPISSVKAASSEYLVVGDRLTDYFRGFIDITRVSMPAPPGCIPPPDGGPPPDTAVPPDTVVPPDTAVPPDTVVPLDAGTPDTSILDGSTVDTTSPDSMAQLDISAPADIPLTVDAKTPGSDGQVASWDLSTPDLGATPGDSDAGCECALSLAAPREGSSAGWVLLLGLLAGLATRRRR